MMTLKRCKLRSGRRDHEIKVQRSETRSKRGERWEEENEGYDSKKKLCLVGWGAGGKWIMKWNENEGEKNKMRMEGWNAWKSTVFWVVTPCRFERRPTFRRNISPPSSNSFIYVMYCVFYEKIIFNQNILIVLDLSLLLTVPLFCCLFNDAISSSGSISSNDCMIMANDLEIMRKEAVLAWFKA
jgi:hypothetical protein